MLNKVLPYNTEIPVKALPQCAVFLSIISGNGFDITPVLFNNCITYFAIAKLWHVYYLADWLALGSFPRKLLHNEKNPKFLEEPLDFLRNEINYNHYATIFLNKDRLFGGEGSTCLDYMIVGYDDENEAFHLAGYFVNNDDYPELEKFCIKEFSYQSVLRSLPYDSNISYPILWWLGDLKHRYRLSSSIPDGFSIPKIKYKKIRFELFLYAYNILPLTFNLRAYAEIKKKPYSIVMLKTINEHAQVILMLIIHFAPGSAYEAAYKRVVAKTQLILVLAVESINGKKDNRIKICSILDSIKSEEEMILKAFYQKYKRKISRGLQRESHVERE